ncbi:hypothetical protein LCGC14_1171930 [marine sediment metagenome]|uniref:Uncharacterized protein n=1 Tax=marine sediment metagenome TaxID=412755 RepID=A0A0F9PV48_9ZZZZ|nr:hypothetical protein [Porticoccus sp.]
MSEPNIPGSLLVHAAGSVTSAGLNFFLVNATVTRTGLGIYTIALGTEIARDERVIFCQVNASVARDASVNGAASLPGSFEVRVLTELGGLADTNFMFVVLRVIV